MEEWRQRRLRGALGPRRLCVSGHAEVKPSVARRPPRSAVLQVPLQVPHRTPAAGWCVGGRTAVKPKQTKGPAVRRDCAAIIKAACRHHFGVKLPAGVE